MKKLSKKAWKEYVEEPSNWEVHTSVPEFGYRISRLKETDLFALEEWHEPIEYARKMGVKPSWRVKQLFYVRENDDGQRYPESTNKTNAIEELWSKQEGKS